MIAYFFDHQILSENRKESYPNLSENPYLTKKMRSMIKPYLLPVANPLKPKLDAIFSYTRVVADEKSLIDAGFEIITSATGSYVTVVRHPTVPGYIFKLYLDTETRFKDGIPNWEWLTKRCIGAAKIRHVIRTKNIRHFTIPDKWLYLLPTAPTTSHGVPVIVVETDMQIEETQLTEIAWQTRITRKHLDELYAILKHGYGTIGLVRNIPYTKNGTFAFTDTEYPVRPLKLKRALPYLSPEMQKYWAQLIR